jgi:hypothetical protein
MMAHHRQQDPSPAETQGGGLLVVGEVGETPSLQAAITLLGRLESANR